MTKYIIDTNFILRYLLADNQKQYKETQKLFDQVKNGNMQIILEQSVFVEVIFVLVSVYKTPKDEVVRGLQDLLLYKGIDADKKLLHNALAIYRCQKLHIVDCIVAAKTALVKGNILTFDKALKSIIENER